MKLTLLFIFISMIPSSLLGMQAQKRAYDRVNTTTDDILSSTSKRIPLSHETVPSLLSITAHKVAQLCINRPFESAISLCDILPAEMQLLVFSCLVKQHFRSIEAALIHKPEVPKVKNYWLSPQKDYCCALLETGKLEFWDMTNRFEVKRNPTSLRNVLSLNFNKDGSRCLVLHKGSNDLSLTVFDIRNATFVIMQTIVLFEETTDHIRFCKISVSNDGQSAGISFLYGQNLIVYSLGTVDGNSLLQLTDEEILRPGGYESMLLSQKGLPLTMTLAPDKRSIQYSRSDNEIQERTFTADWYFHDDYHLVSPDQAYAIYKHEAATSSSSATHPQKSYTLENLLTQEKLPVTTLDFAVFSPDSAYMYTAENTSIYRYKLSEFPKCKKELLDQSNGPWHITALKISRSNKFLCVYYTDINRGQRIRIYNLRTHCYQELDLSSVDTDTFEETTVSVKGNALLIPNDMDSDGDEKNATKLIYFNGSDILFERPLENDYNYPLRALNNKYLTCTLNKEIYFFYNPFTWLKDFSLYELILFIRMIEISSKSEITSESIETLNAGLVLLQNKCNTSSCQQIITQLKNLLGK